jgi:penicillin-binding protein 1A
MQKVGIDTAIEQAKTMGITTIDSNKNYGLALALGTAEVPLMQMTNAYAAFANQGQQFPTTIIKQVNDKYDNNIFKSNEKSKVVISKEGAYLISDILSDNNARAPIFGSSLTVRGNTAAVKTGTTNDNRDAWTIGYTPQLAVGIWVGNNNNAAMNNGGSGMAGPIWVDTMRAGLQGIPDTKFPMPSGIVQRAVCYSNGGLASGSGNGTYNEYFLAWGLPTATCTPVEPPKKQEETPKQEDKPTTETPTTPVTPPTTTDPGTTPTTPGTGGGTGTTPTIPNVTH